MDKIIKGDCLLKQKKIKDNSIDLIYLEKNQERKNE